MKGAVVVLSIHLEISSSRRVVSMLLSPRSKRHSSNTSSSIRKGVMLIQAPHEQQNPASSRQHVAGSRNQHAFSAPFDPLSYDLFLLFCIIPPAVGCTYPQARERGIHQLAECRERVPYETQFGLHAYSTINQRVFIREAAALRGDRPANHFVVRRDRLEQIVGHARCHVDSGSTRQLLQPKHLSSDLLPRCETVPRRRA